MTDEAASAKEHASPAVHVVTGAASGIGRHIALRLASEQQVLALVDIDGPGLAATARECEALGARQASWTIDVADGKAMAQLPERISNTCGVPVALYNIAGVIMAGRLADSDLVDVQRVIAVDLQAVITSCHAFLPYLETAKQARIVNVSSAFGLIGVGGYSAYCAAKFGVRGFTEALMQEVPPHVRVSYALPGGVRTDIMRNGHFASTVDPRAIQKQFDLHIARASPERVAQQILRQASRGHRRIVVGNDARLVDLLARLTGTGYQRLSRRMSIRHPG